MNAGFGNLWAVPVSRQYCDEHKDPQSMKPLYVSLLLALLLPMTAAAQATIKGRVIDEHTEEPLQGVHVDLRTPENLQPGHPVEARTNARGQYVLKNVPAGRWRIRATYDGPTVITEMTSPAAEIQRKTFVLNFAFRVLVRRDATDSCSLPAAGWPFLCKFCSVSRSSRRSAPSPRSFPPGAGPRKFQSRRVGIGFRPPPRRRKRPGTSRG